MRLTDVETITLDIPFNPRPAKYMAPGNWNWTVIEVCRVTSETGEVGYGETVQYYTWRRVEKEQVHKVLGRNPFDLLWDDSLGAGLQMAIYDLAGKELGVPCYRLLGRKVRDWCPISWWSIDMPPQDWAEEAKQAQTLGYRDLKLKARPWFDLIEQVQAVGEVAPPHFRFDLDFNGLLVNAGYAVPMLHQLDSYSKVAMYESPIPQEDIQGYGEIKAKIKRPIAIHYGNPPIMTALREDVCDGFVIGGGVASVTQQAIVAATANKPFWLQLVGTGITTAFALHLGAVLTHAQWPAITCHEIYSDDLLKNRIEILDGYAHVPEEPGLGVEVDEAALEHLRVDSIEKPEPEHVYCVSWPSGRKVYYGHAVDYYRDFAMGNQPLFERGVRLEILTDDGNQRFAELRRHVEKGPFLER